MARVYRGTDEVVAHLPGVRAAVKVEAEAAGARASALLAGHRQTGVAHIEVDTAGDPDYLVSLVDEDGVSATAIEFGRGGYTDAKGRRVGPMEGLAVLRRATGLL